MYQAIPYSAGRPWPRPAPAMGVEAAAAVAEEERLLAAAQQQQPSAGAEAAARGEEVRRAVAECPVLVVGKRGCCLSHVVKRHRRCPRSPPPRTSSPRPTRSWPHARRSTTSLSPAAPPLVVDVLGFGSLGRSSLSVRLCASTLRRFVWVN
uniref:Grx_I1-glutaredoxin subgroup III n=1 Tax=Zea mays TaxID=4577 RepID=B6TJX5_MAIZE|nr:Grx_I1 - glutaredoxin subgroup III [Zea mays]